MQLSRALLFGTVGTAVLALQVPASAQPEQGPGTVQLTFAAPDGVAFNVGLDGRTAAVAGKAPAGTTGATALTLPEGAYHVVLPTVTADGVRYTGTASRPEVVVREGETAALHVAYTAEPGAVRLHATTVAATALDLAWTAAEGSRFSLRRAVGSVAPAQRNDGQEVATSGTAATDRGLEVGTEYSYSLFTQHHSRWYGPLSITVSTEAAAGSDRASFVAAPSTLLAGPDDLTALERLPAGVRVGLRGHVPARLLGSAVVLPVSAALPGGFLGTVSALSQDGRTVDLVAAGLADAFDYYDLDVADIGAVAQQEEAVPEESPQTAAAAAPDSAPATARVPSRGGERRSSGPAVSRLAAVDTECGKTRVDGTLISFDPDIDLDGRFETHVDKYSFLGVEVPTGASVDMAMTATVTGAAKVEATANVRCNIKLPRVFRTFATYPVPMAISIRPTAEVNVEGVFDVENVGFTATAGMEASAKITLTGIGFDSGPIQEAGPLVPVVKTANGAVDVRVGGEVIVGPGAGTGDLGVIAGIGGEWYPLDVRVSPHWPFPDPRFVKCLDVSAAMTGRLTLTAQAFLGKLSASATAVLLEGSRPYFGSPWSLPSGCEDLPEEGTPDSLLGPGVDKVDDEIGGTDDQWGRVDGFIPGARAWVLSTGRIGDAVGAPSAFASTDLGAPGDSQLSELSGRPTYDAASYRVTVVPKGPTLKVRYVFASEEYPEYAGSAYNDVMAVRVGGVDCAWVPGTALAVSVNTINARTNSELYVDNTSGAAGYGTSMDGLTVPLTCSVPVTPGVPVSVRIAVADSSDGVYDSAVALVDGGITSE